MKMRIVHISDPHFGTIKQGMREALRRSLQEISPHLIVISGDITQRARASQFVQASEFVKSLSEFPVVVIPGNHDIPLFNIFGRLISPYSGFNQMAESTLGREVVLQGVQVLALNSTSRFRHVQGALDLAKLKISLENAPAGIHTRVVFFHHPMDCPHHVDKKNLLRNREKVLEILEEHRVDLVLSGHIHDPLVSLSQEAYKNVKRSLIIGVAGTCLSWRTRPGAPNSFNLVEIDTNSQGEEQRNRNAIAISRYDINEKLVFTCISKSEFLRIPNQGWRHAAE
jgi:3',5'-cyclic AMP phosphodiesterase CpdA